MDIKNAKYEISSPGVRQCPATGVPEYAFIGRSNVGKSTKEKTIAAQWPLDSQEPFTVTLPAGSYDLRIAGKSAGFEGEVSLALNGQALSWDDMLDAVQDVVEKAVTGELQDTLQDVTDSLQQTFGDEQTAT